jgi:hypothetical protein
MVLRFPVMEKKLTNSGPLMASTRKHSIYTRNPLAINKYFSIISQGGAPGKRLVPGGALAIRSKDSIGRAQPQESGHEKDAHG